MPPIRPLRFRGDFQTSHFRDYHPKVSITLSITPHGRLFVEESADAPPLTDAAANRIARAFEGSLARGLLHLATVELQAHLPPTFAFARDFARDYLTRLSRTPA